MCKTGIHYLDTSALVKILLYPDVCEGGSEALARFRKGKASFFTIDLCVGEALNVLKRKHFSKAQVVSMDGYLMCINRLICSQKPSHTLKVNPVALDGTLFTKAKSIVENYGIDFVDAALAIAALAHEPYTFSQNLLITADESLQRACIDMNINVWNCVREEPPA